MLIMTAQFLLSLTILVVLHEFGHFLPARWFKTRVEKFYVFFHPWFSLYKKKIGETEWGIGWLPLGGYVKIAGMIDESMDKDQMEGPVQPWEFRAKPAWQRLIIMLGGVTVNFILGFFLFGLITFIWGKSYTPSENVTEGIYVDSLGMELGLRDGDKILFVGDTKFEKFNQGTIFQEVALSDAKKITVERNGSKVDLPITQDHVHMLTTFENSRKSLFGPRIYTDIDNIVEDSKAEELGLKKGDKILSLNGESTRYFHEFTEALAKYKEAGASLTYLRGVDTMTTNFTLAEDELLGFHAALPGTISEKFGFGESMVMGVKQGVRFLTGQIRAFGKMFTGEIKAKESLGSFLSIGSQFGSELNWLRFWNMTAMLSLILAFLNLLPIPALDGGYVMFLIWEVVTGRKVSDKVMEYANMAGFFLLILFMIYALGLDISRFF